MIGSAGPTLEELATQRQRLNEKMRALAEDPRLPEAQRAKLRAAADRDLMDDMIGRKRNIVRLDRYRG